MDYRITLLNSWRPDHRLIHPGTYRVPEDMSPTDAERALTEAGAEKYRPQQAEPEGLTEPDMSAKKKSRGRPPKNKSALD